METKAEFSLRVNNALKMIDPSVLQYNIEEFDMIERAYKYIRNYFYEKRLFNAAVALPLARGLHNGVYRKGTVLRNGVPCRPPYVIHCINVCRMLIDLRLPMSREEEDFVLAAALCHDMIEDCDFENGGTELMTEFGLDRRVYETVQRISKRRDFTEEEHKAYFRGISEDPLALLIKLADRGNNVEDMYNMKTWKIHEYVGETRDSILPMCDFGMLNYHELVPCIMILRDKIVSLIDMAEILADRCDLHEAELKERLESLKTENELLTAVLAEMEAE